jgi:hypothetical protein
MEDEPFDEPIVKPFMGPAWGISELSFDTNYVVQNNIRQTTIDHCLVIYARDTYGQDGSVRNRAIIDATKGKAAHDWSGPIVVLSQDGPQNNPYPISRDVTLSDLRTVVDYFMI